MSTEHFVLVITPTATRNDWLNWEKEAKLGIAVVVMKAGLVLRTSGGGERRRPRYLCVMKYVFARVRNKKWR